MNKHIFISYSHKDEDDAKWLWKQLQQEGFNVFLDVENIPPGSKWEPELETAIQKSSCVIVLVSPYSAVSEHVRDEVDWARQYSRPLVPILIRETDPLPSTLQEIQMADFTTHRDKALHRLVNQSLKEYNQGITLGEARDAYLSRATLKSQHTVDAYARAINLFFEFLSDRSTMRSLPILNIKRTVQEIPLAALVEDDAPLFLHFAQWLLSPNSGKKGDKRPYKPSTVELRLAGLQNWFQFLDDYGWLPGEFKLAKAKRIVRDELRSRPQHGGPPQPPEYIEEVIYYYDTQQLPKHLRKPNVDQARVQRWQLTRLRNRALLHTLAETGGRVSEILSLNLADFPPRYLEKNDVLRVQVIGKGGHSYYLRFFDSLAAIRAYIQARGANLRASLHGDVPLFVSHDPRYTGNRMSRIVAWRVVQRASRALGLRSITPHDFRHWRATQLINAGHSLDVIQDYLGHRSVETTRAYYAHTDPLRVDDAAKATRLPDPDGAEEDS